MKKALSINANGSSVSQETYSGPVLESPLDTLSFEHLRLNPPVLMNEREVAVVLNVCQRSVRNFTAQKILPVIRLGRRRLFRREAVMAALQMLESDNATGSRNEVYSKRK